MAATSKRADLSGAIALFLLACSLRVFAQTAVSLEQAAERTAPDFIPVLEGRSVIVSGQVSTKPIRILDYTHVAIQERGKGLILEGSSGILDRLAPGEWVEAQGRISRRGGLPVLVVSRISVVSAGVRPVPLETEPRSLQSLRLLGLLVVTEGDVEEIGFNAAGAYMRVGSGGDPLKVFLPNPPDKSVRGFAGVSVGDKVRITGVSYQFCPSPPHDRNFELLVEDAKDVSRLNGGWRSQTRGLRPILLAMILAGLFWWRRERIVRTQRAMLRTVYGLGEEILGAGSSTEILAKISAVLPKVLRVTSVHFYLYDRGSKMLETVTGEAPSSLSAIPLDSPLGLLETGAANCFQNKRPLLVADSRRSPFPVSQLEKTSSFVPRSVLFVPMLAQSEPVGVLQMENAHHVRNFTPDEEAVAQHLANQMGLAVKLLQQRSFHEQLSRSEKLAAVGRLISGVVNDLQTPLEAISSMAQSVLEQHPASAPGHELLVIAWEARRASAIVTRLVSFAQPESIQAEPVDVNLLLREMIRFREREWKACGIQFRNRLKDARVFVMGSQGQLEQVFLNLFVHAEQSLEEATGKHIAVCTDVLAKRVVIEIGYNAVAAAASPNPPDRPSSRSEVSALGLDVCRGIISGHGGEMRMVANARETKFELEFPWLSIDPPEEPSPVERPRISRRWTVLLLEPEELAERRLIDSLASRGYRVVPVKSSEEGLDLVQRLRFDVVFCSTGLTGLNWVEFFDRVRGRVGAFTLLAEAFSHDLSAHFRGEGRYVLHKPIDQDQFDRTLEAVEARLLDAETKAPEVESY